MHDAHILIMYKDNEKFLEKFENKMNASFDSYFSEGGVCKRFTKHESDFVRHSYIRLERELQLEQAQEFDTDGSNLARYGESLEKALPDFYDPEMERLKRLKSSRKPPSTIPIIEMANDDIEEDLKYIFRKRSTIKVDTTKDMKEKLEMLNNRISESDGNTNNSEKPVPVLRPKSQEATIAYLKLPKINKLDIN